MKGYGRYGAPIESISRRLQHPPTFDRRVSRRPGFQALQPSHAQRLQRQRVNRFLEHRIHFAGHLEAEAKV